METSVISATASELTDRIYAGQFKIAIYGLGHVGAPLASVWLHIGAHVIGVDKSLTVIENARAGRTHIPEPNVNEAFSIGLREKRCSKCSRRIRAIDEIRIQYPLICWACASTLLNK